jgi:cell fate (sporulation/competence/biofilm development) regulator YlbF (YheA/YmcA/DUF963 family)
VNQVNSEIDDIIQKARELAQLLKQHSATVHYEEDLKRLRGDEQSLQLYSKLVQMGRELAEKASRGEEIAMEDSEQNRIIRDELEKNELVKSFIRSQRAYLELIQKITDRIKNPKRD